MPVLPDAVDSTPSAKPKVRRMLRIALFVVGGAIAGFLYYRFVGCRSGACPLTSNPYISTLYGAFMGLLMGRL